MHTEIRKNRNSHTRIYAKFTLGFLHTWLVVPNLYNTRTCFTESTFKSLKSRYYWHGIGHRVAAGNRLAEVVQQWAANPEAPQSSPPLSVSRGWGGGRERRREGEIEKRGQERERETARPLPLPLHFISVRINISIALSPRRTPTNDCFTDVFYHK